MGLPLLIVIVLGLSLVVVILIARRLELARMSQRLSDVVDAKRSGSHTARLQYPHIDLSRCIGCGTCVAACPEEDVLDMIHGQAAVVHGARCVGHGKCAAACPVGAIGLTLADIRARTDIPVLDQYHETCDTPGLFLAGEVTGYALIRTAIAHGTTVVNRIAENLFQQEAKDADPRDGVLDLVIVGAGPAGLAASLRAKQLGLSFVTLEQDQLGGTVAKYPRRKLVMTQPVELPLHGKLTRSSYSKEQLIELWSDVVRKHNLPIRTGQEFIGAERIDEGFLVQTKSDRFRCRKVCICIGRRGTPRKLGVPGESLAKVAYQLIDANSYRQRRILVVGGGDSAIEAALGLSIQPGNEVTLSYRGQSFSRLKSRNQAALQRAAESRQLVCLLQSEVQEVRGDSVALVQDRRQLEIPNDDVFIMIGGTPPFQLLSECGVSFDPAKRPAPPTFTDQGTGLVAALSVATCFALGLLVWVWWFREYYQLPLRSRPISTWHSSLRPSGLVGVSAGIASAVLILANLCYLLRRNWFRNWIPGSLVTWMTSHVATGIMAFLLVLIHAAFAPKHTVGGHAFVGLVVLVVSGAVGRYFYSVVPRAANGKELDLDEIQSMVVADSAEWDSVGREFHSQVLDEIHELVVAARWKSNFANRLTGLLRTNAESRRKFRQLKSECCAHGLTDEQTRRVLGLANRAYKTALGIAHFEDLRAILNSWRYLHRWMALLMVLLVIAHVASAWKYSVSFK